MRAAAYCARAGGGRRRYSRVRVRPGANARAFIGHVAGDRQFISSSPGVRADYRWEEADFAYIRRFDHVHTSIYSELGDALPQIAANTPSFSLDASNRWNADYLQAVRPHVRFLFLSPRTDRAGGARSWPAMSGGRATGGGADTRRMARWGWMRRAR
jgi:sugar/nucleoside kinase (ribokinase family)